MSADIINLLNPDDLVGDGYEIPVAGVLDAAKQCTRVVVAGITEDGDLYLASSVAIPEMLWLLAKAQNDLLNLEL